MGPDFSDYDFYDSALDSDCSDSNESEFSDSGKSSKLFRNKAKLITLNPMTSTT